MANTLTSHRSPKMVAVVVAFLSLLVLIQKGEAYEFKVGGSGDWSPTSTSYNQWAEKTRFQVGDTSFFKYQGEKDSVLQVSKDDYNNCNTASPIARHDDGPTMIKFDWSGPHYFISRDGHRISRRVLRKRFREDRTHKSLPQSPPSPAPVSNKSPPPSSPNGASSVVMSLLCFIGAFACFMSW